MHPENVKVSRVTGEPEPRFPPAYLREDEKRCGAGAEWFEEVPAGSPVLSEIEGIRKENDDA